MLEIRLMGLALGNDYGRYAGVAELVSFSRWDTHTGLADSTTINASTIVLITQERILFRPNASESSHHAIRRT